jgi:hypothetical protein
MGVLSVGLPDLGSSTAWRLDAVPRAASGESAHPRKARSASSRWHDSCFLGKVKTCVRRGRSLTDNGPCTHLIQRENKI